MNYNKNQTSKIKEKKILRKVKKNWVVLSLSFFGAISVGNVINHDYVAQADTTANVTQTNPVHTDTTSSAAKQSATSATPSHTSSAVSTASFAVTSTASTVASSYDYKSSVVTDSKSTSSVDSNTSATSAVVSSTSDNSNQYTSLRVDSVTPVANRELSNRLLDDTNTGSEVTNVSLVSNNPNSLNSSIGSGPSFNYTDSADPDTGYYTASLSVNISNNNSSNYPTNLSFGSKATLDNGVLVSALANASFNGESPINGKIQNLKITYTDNNGNKQSFNVPDNEVQKYYNFEKSVTNNFQYDSNGNLTSNDFNFDRNTDSDDSYVTPKNVSYVSFNSNIFNAVNFNGIASGEKANLSLSFNVKPNDNFYGLGQGVNINSSTLLFPTISYVPTIQINYINDNDNSNIQSTQYVSAADVKSGDYFKDFNIKTPSGYSYSKYDVSNGSTLSLSNTSNNSVNLSGTFGSASNYISNLQQGKVPQSDIINIHYIPAVQNVTATVKYMDVNNSDNPTEISSTSSSFSGAIGSVANYSTQTIVNSLSDAGYSLTSGSPATSLTLNSSNNSYEFDFVHKMGQYTVSSHPSTMSSADFEKTFATTINFVDAATGSSISSAVSQTATYDRTATYDKVTGNISGYSDWTANRNYPDYTAPLSINGGYTNPQPASISILPNDVNGPLSAIATIKYTKNAAENKPIVQNVNVTVKYMDVNDGTNPTEIRGTSSSFSGTVGSVASYSTQSVVDSLSDAGYSLTSGYPTSSLKINSSNNDYVFDFIHKIDQYDASSHPSTMSNADFEKTFTRTINLVDAATGKPITSSAAQSVTYNRTVKYDEVTKSTSYSDWTTNNSNYPEYDAPSVDDYENPQPASVASEPVDVNGPLSISATINYNKKPASVSTYTPTSSVSSDATLILYTAKSSATSSSSISVVASSISATTSSSAVNNYRKMYNNKTKLVKQDEQIQIYIEPKYASDSENGSLANQYVVNRTISDGKVVHDQPVTLEQYNAMLSASGKQPFTTDTLDQAYQKRQYYQGIMHNRSDKTTFDAKTVSQGNDTLIDTSGANYGFNQSADKQLVPDTDDLRVPVHNTKTKKQRKIKVRSHHHANKMKHMKMMHHMNHKHHASHHRNHK